MSIQVYDCEQGSAEWMACRLGIPTASMFSAILAKGEGKTRRKYLLQLAAEVITGEPLESYSNQFMDRGKAMEADAREFYGFTRNVEPQCVGFIRNGDKGCSPDSLIGDAGMLEIKTQRPDLLIETLLKDGFPPEHKAQCQGGLWVAEREWIDICVYWPGIPKLIKRAPRDETYIANLASEVSRFSDELAQTVDTVRRLGQEALAA